jgi:RNA polymerase sigma factor (sigma-70 family)
MDYDENIFSNLIEENKDKIYRICCYYISGEEERKDLYQEVLLNIWKGFRSFKKEAAFSTWVFRIAVNTALAYLTKKRSIQKRKLQYADFIKTQESKTELSGIEEINILHKGISDLPLLDMIIISLVLEEVSSKEIAKITGLTESNVRVRTHRAKEKLKELLKGDL